MGVSFEKIGHSCGTRTGLQVFYHEDRPEGSQYDGYCFACNKVVDDPYEEGHVPDKQKLDKPDFKKQLGEIRSLKPCDLPTRHLRKEVLALYGVRVGLSQTDGETPTEVYFPYFKGTSKIPARVKVRVLEPKRMWSYSSGEKDIDLFGWQQAVAAGTRKLYITEGEFDAMAVRTILERFNKGDYDIPVPVSLPNGAATAKKDLTRLSKKIRQHFDEIVLVFDKDAAGQKAQADVLSVFPEAKVVVFAQKDANDALREAPKAAFAALVFKAAKPKNTRLVAAEDLHEIAKVQAEMGVSWPWPKLTDMTRGIRTGETIYLGAGAKLG